MKCHDAEKMILNEDLSPEVLSHIEECESCKSYYDLLSFEPLEVDVDAEVKQALDIGIKTKQKRDYYSLLGFMIILICLCISVYNFIDLKSLVILQGIASFVTPVILLVYIINRKEAINE